MFISPAPRISSDTFIFQVSLRSPHHSIAVGNNFRQCVLYNGATCMHITMLTGTTNMSVLCSSQTRHAAEAMPVMCLQHLKHYSEANDNDPAMLPAEVAELFDCIGERGLRWLLMKCNKSWFSMPKRSVGRSFFSPGICSL